MTLDSTEWLLRHGVTITHTPHRMTYESDGIISSAPMRGHNDAFWEKEFVLSFIEALGGPTNNGGLYAITHNLHCYADMKMNIVRSQPSSSVDGMYLSVEHLRGGRWYGTSCVCLTKDLGNLPFMTRQLSEIRWKVENAYEAEEHPPLLISMEA